MKTFICPICRKEIDLRADFGVLSQSSDHYEYRISNKRYHLRLHKAIKLLSKKLLYHEKEVKRLQEEIDSNNEYLQ